MNVGIEGGRRMTAGSINVSGVVDAGEKEINPKLAQKRKREYWSDAEKSQVIKYITSNWSSFCDNKTPHFSYISVHILQQRKAFTQVRYWWIRFWQMYKAVHRLEEPMTGGRAHDSDDNNLVNAGRKPKYSQRALDTFKKTEIYSLVHAAAREDPRTDFYCGFKDGHHSKSNVSVVDAGEKEINSKLGSRTNIVQDGQHSNAIQDDPNLLAQAQGVIPRDLGTIHREGMVAPDRGASDGALGCGNANRVLESLGDCGVPEGDFNVPQGLGNHHTAVREADVWMDRGITDMIRHHLNDVRHQDSGDSHVGLDVNQGPALGYGDLNGIGIGSNYTLEDSLARGNTGVALANGYSDMLLGNPDGPLSCLGLERDPNGWQNRDDCHVHFEIADAGIGLDGSSIILGRSDHAYGGGSEGDFNIELDCHGLDDIWRYYCNDPVYMLQGTSNVFAPDNLEGDSHVSPARADSDTIRANSDVMLTDSDPDTTPECSDVRIDTAVHLEEDSHVLPASADSDTVRANSIDSGPDAAPESPDVRMDTAVHLEEDSHVSPARADSDAIRANSNVMFTDSDTDAAPECSDVRIDTGLKAHADSNIVRRDDSDEVIHQIETSIPITRDEERPKNLDDVLTLLQRAIALNESYFTKNNRGATSG